MTALVTGLYAAPLAGLVIVLSARVIIYRRGKAISLGDGGAAGSCARAATLRNMRPLA